MQGGAKGEAGRGGNATRFPLRVRPGTHCQHPAQPPSAKLWSLSKSWEGDPSKKLLPGPSRPWPAHLHELFHGLGCQGVRTEEGVGVGWEDRRKCLLGFGGLDVAHSTHPR